LRIDLPGDPDNVSTGRAFGRLTERGVYATTVTRPALYADYLAEQLRLILEDYAVTVTVHLAAGNPLSYVLDGTFGAEIGAVRPQDLARHFPTTELAEIGDEIADAEYFVGDGPFPLSLFDGLRTDFSLARLAHYTGTRAEDFQRYILFTNYHRYVDEFVDWAGRQLGTGRFTALTGAGGLQIDATTDSARDRLSDTAWRRHQMPAYHLIAPDRSGITLVNIGVGPSNAKTICDHLAVLRPEAWLMIGHCGGLRPTQKIGDYVLAHAYLRDDHVLDPVLPPEIPIPAIAEVQVALRGRRRTGQRHRRNRSQAADADRHRGHHRRPQLGIALLALGPSAEPVARGRHRHGKCRHRGTGLSFPRALRHFAVRVGKPLHGKSSCRDRPTAFTRKRSPRIWRSGPPRASFARTGARLHSRKLRAFNEPPFR
jgi:AMP nucleosidase